MIRNRTICKQVDMTDNDLSILLHLSLSIEPRKTDRRDADIMRLRTAAHTRGASPVDIQTVVLNLE